MPGDTKERIRQLSDHMMEMDNGNFLLSEQFSRFCREYDIDEIWDGLLASAGDRPDLYGKEGLRHAFSRLLEHLYQKKRADFPRILSGLVALVPKKASDLLYLSTIRKDLSALGYSRDDAEVYFSAKGSQ